MRRGVLIVTSLCAVACGSFSSSSPDSSSGVTIAVIPKGTSHVFWQSIHAGARKAADELGVRIIWRGPLREDDRASQVAESKDSSPAAYRALCWRRSTTQRWSVLSAMRRARRFR